MHLTANFDVLLSAIQGAGHAFPSTWGAFSQSAAALALTAAWQGAVIALGLAICLRLAPHSPARHRFALWATGFGTLVGLQFLPLISHFLHAHAIAASATVSALAAPVVASHPWLQLDARWSILIAALWLAASLYRAADLTLHSLELRKLWKFAVPVEVDADSLPASFAQLGRRPLQICTTGQLERPSVIGFFSPRILIPDWLFSRLTPGEFKQIILHEAEHLRRHDDWTNLLQKLCLVFFPLNPGLAWIERRLCREREMACDDGVIRITRSPRAYAACLTSLAERGLQRRAGALSLGFWRRRPELVGRVHSVLRRKPTLGPAAARAVLAAVSCVLLMGAVELARCPKLIAFVPAHHVAKANSGPVQSARTSVPRPIQEAALSAISRPLAKDVSAKLLSRHSQAPAAKSELPASVSHARPAPKVHSTASEMATIATESKPFTVATTEGPDQPGGFVVLTTWQSVETPGLEPKRPSGQAGSYSDAATQNTHTVFPERAFQFKHQIMVTRLLLRFYAAESGTKPAAQSETYTGWLVIQL